MDWTRVHLNGTVNGDASEGIRMAAISLSLTGEAFRIANTVHEPRTFLPAQTWDLKNEPQMGLQFDVQDAGSFRLAGWHMISRYDKS